MINFSHYIKAKSVADTYLDHISDLSGSLKKQHFLTRLSLCQGYGHILDDPRKKQSLYTFMRKDLERKLSMSFDEMWNESMGDDEYGYKKDIKKQESEDIKFYFGMTDIIGEVCVLIRNKQEVPEGIEKRINRRYLLKMIEIADKDDIMRSLEGTTYVNGIGGIICLKKLKNSLVPINWDTINECYRKMWDYYLDKCEMGEWKHSKRSLHNDIYGLTHCVINLSNFYTDVNNVQNSDQFLPEVRRTQLVLSEMLSSQKSSNYVIFNDDTLAEMLLCLRLCGGEFSAERLAALDSLSLRFDSAKLIFREHKKDSLKDEIAANEHTNILYIMNILF